MKRSGFDHPKLGRLCKLLGIPRYAAVGLAESLWHFAGRHAPAGDVGKWSDAEIADSMGWTEPAERLIQALVEARLLDEVEGHRLVVHDWDEHCEDSIHLTLARRTEFFANGKMPRLTRLSSDERKQVAERYAEASNTHGMHTACTQKHTEAHCLSLSLSQAKPSQASAKPLPAPEPLLDSPNGESLSGKPDRADVRQVFDHYRTHHPKSHPKPASASKEWRLIAARLKEGYSAADLCAAIDGCHKSPFHCGENDRGQKYHNLELIVRDGSQVAKFIECNANPPPSGLSAKTIRGVAAGDQFLRERMGHANP